MKCLFDDDINCRNGFVNDSTTCEEIPCSYYVKLSVMEWNKIVSKVISLEWKTDKPNFNVKFYDKDSCLLTLDYMGWSQSNVIENESDIIEMVKSFKKCE